MPPGNSPCRRRSVLWNEPSLPPCCCCGFCYLFFFLAITIVLVIYIVFDNFDFFLDLCCGTNPACRPAVVVGFVIVVLFFLLLLFLMFLLSLKICIVDGAQLDPLLFFVIVFIVVFAVVIVFEYLDLIFRSVGERTELAALLLLFLYCLCCCFISFYRHCYCETLCYIPYFSSSDISITRIHSAANEKKPSSFHSVDFLTARNQWQGCRLKNLFAQPML